MLNRVKCRMKAEIAAAAQASRELFDLPRVLVSILLGNTLVPCLLGPGDVLVHTKALGDGDAAEGGGETADEDDGVHLREGNESTFCSSSSTLTSGLTQVEKK